jgi:hypothetical protein
MYPSQKKVKTLTNNEPVSKDEAKKINEAILECIIEDSRPFGDFRKPGMQKFLKKFWPNFVPWHQKTITNKLRSRYIKYKKQLKALFANISDISLTTDAWKRKNLQYYLTLTAHFFDHDFNYFSLIIGFRKFMGRHLQERLKEFIENELKSLNIIDKISAITTDNAADIKSATSSGFGIRFSCLAHNLNLTVKPVTSHKKP